jgi:hypothetical protein
MSHSSFSGFGDVARIADVVGFAKPRGFCLSGAQFLQTFIGKGGLFLNPAKS